MNISHKKQKHLSDTSEKLEKPCNHSFCNQEDPNEPKERPSNNVRFRSRCLCSERKVI